MQICATYALKLQVVQKYGATLKNYKWQTRHLYLSLQLDWGLVWLPRGSASCRFLGGGRSMIVLVVVEAEVSDVLFKIRSIRSSISFFLLSHPSEIQACGTLLCSCSFLVFGCFYKSFRAFNSVWPQQTLSCPPPFRCPINPIFIAINLPLLQAFASGKKNTCLA